MYTTDFAKTQADYRRTELSRSWSTGHHLVPRVLDRVRRNQHAR